jgi:hypothetical protein
MVIRPTADVAEVVVNGSVVGNVSWTMSAEDPQVNVSIEPSASQLVLEWAAELGGEFREEPRFAEQEA